MEPQYRELLADTNACSVALGFDMFMELEKGKRLDDALFLDSIVPLLDEKAKIRSKTALQLIDKIAKRNPPLRRESLAALAQDVLVQVMNDGRADTAVTPPPLNNAIQEKNNIVSQTKGITKSHVRRYSREQNAHG